MPLPPHDPPDLRTRQRYAAARHAAGATGAASWLGAAPGGPLLLVSGNASGAVAARTLALDLDALVAAMTRTRPPGAAALERLILTVEDAVMPAAALPARGTLLLLGAPALEPVLKIAGDGRTASLDAVEATYRRLASIAQGRPMRHDPSLPLDAPFATALVLLRECMHHLGYTQVRAVA